MARYAGGVSSCCSLALPTALSGPAVTGTQAAWLSCISRGLPLVLHGEQACWLGLGQGTGGAPMPSHSFLPSEHMGHVPLCTQHGLLGGLCHRSNLDGSSVCLQVRQTKAKQKQNKAGSEVQGPAGHSSSLCFGLWAPCLPGFSLGVLLPGDMLGATDAIATCGSFRGRGQPVSLTCHSCSLGLLASNQTRSSVDRCGRQGTQVGPSGDA